MLPARATLREAALAIALGAAFACARSAPRPAIDERRLREAWLPRLEEGVTRRAHVLADLGRPTIELEGGRILGYRLVVSERLPDAPAGDAVAARPPRDEGTPMVWVVREPSPDIPVTWELACDGEYGLVLVFDEAGTLRRHSVTRVLP